MRLIGPCLPCCIFGEIFWPSSTLCWGEFPHSCRPFSHGRLQRCLIPPSLLGTLHSLCHSGIQSPSHPPLSATEKYLEMFTLEWIWTRLPEVSSCTGPLIITKLVLVLTNCPRFWNVPTETVALNIPFLWVFDLLCSSESPGYLQLAICILNELHCVRELFKNCLKIHFKEMISLHVVFCQQCGF